MKTRAFVQVDVFTAEPYRGNPLAVVLDAQGLDDDRMQQFARWTNLSETVFLFPPTDANADYHVRIYTPGRELPFAGHPTLGSCHAWLAAGGRARAGDEVVQQCGAGLVRIRRDGERLSFAAPPLRQGDVEPETLHAVVRALGVDAKSVRAAQWLDNGPRWLSLLLDDAHTVLKLDPDQAALKSLPNVGVVAPHAAGGECAVRSARLRRIARRRRRSGHRQPQRGPRAVADRGRRRARALRRRTRHAARACRPRARAAARRRGVGRRQQCHLHRGSRGVMNASMSRRAAPKANTAARSAEVA